MAANMAANTQKYVYFRSKVSYNYSSSIEYNIFQVKESSYCSGDSVGKLLSKMAANFGAKTENGTFQVIGKVQLQFQCRI